MFSRARRHAYGKGCVFLLRPNRGGMEILLQHLLAWETQMKP